MEIQDLILNYLREHPNSSSKEVFEGIDSELSYATVKRNLSRLLDENLILKEGKSRNTRYAISPAYNLFFAIDMDEYYSKEIDDRKILTGYNFSLITDVLEKVSLFTNDELTLLNGLQNKFAKNMAQLSNIEYQKEIERLAIEERFLQR